MTPALRNRMMESAAAYGHEIACPVIRSMYFVPRSEFAKDLASAYEAGFTAALEELKPVLEQLEIFNKKFSPGDDWFPEMLRAYKALVAFEGECDPTPWCSYCGAMTRPKCRCGPIAENE